MKLKPLHKADLVGIAAPAGPFDHKAFLKGIGILKKAGLKLRYRRTIFSKKEYLAGADQRRTAELNSFLKDPKVRALLMARGGFGCQRILPLLKGRCSPKVVIGSSDITILLLHLWQRFRLPSYYGPMVAPHFTHPENVRRLVRALTDPQFSKKQRLIAKKTICGGKAEGRLIGGCLSLLVSTLGTPWEVNTKGSILFLEDTNESPYAIDRMLTQLEQAGKLKGVRGIVLGTFKLARQFFPSEVESVFREKFKKFKVPILWGVRFGHHPKPLFIPLGGKGRIVGKELQITQGIF